MPTFEITAPDGNKYQVEGPEGSTEDQALAHFQSQYQPPKPQRQAMGEQLARQLGRTGRIAADTIAAIPLAISDFGIGARNLLTGSNYEDASSMYRGAMDQILPKAEGTSEKVVDIAGQMLLGSRLPSPAIANQAPAGFASRTPTVPVPNGYTSAPQPPTATASSNISVAPEATARGGGYTYGTVGDDASAGLNSTRKEILRAGRDIGMRATPGQATGSRSLMQMEAKLESQPMTSGPFNSIKADNAKTLNKQWAKAIGEKADTVDSNVLARANERLGGVFSSVRDEVPRPIDPKTFVEKFNGINDEFEGLLPQNLSTNPLVKRLYSYAEKGGASGRQLGDLSSKLGRATHKEMTSGSGDRELGQALGQVKDYVDDLVAQGLSGKQLGKYQDARTQYRNFLTLLKPGVTNVSSGDVSGPTLANVLARTDKRGFLLGKNKSDAYTAARFAQGFKPIVGDSGTATRMPLQGLTDLVTRVPANIATRAYVSAPAVNMATAGQNLANRFPQIPMMMTPEQKRAAAFYAANGLLSQE
jgi:hypothetical protein